MNDKWRHNWILAYHWLCQRRQHYPANTDVWHLRFHWRVIGKRLWQAVCNSSYRLKPMQVITAWNGRRTVQWCAEDALIFKWAALCLTPLLAKHPACRHLKGHGGYQASVIATKKAIETKQLQFVYRTDIKGYYEHFPKQRLWQWCQQQTDSPILLNLLYQYINYSVEQHGEFFSPNKGICRGCALSPLIGGSYLFTLDTALSQCRGIFYERYMDDFLLLSPTRWPLKRAIAILQNVLAQDNFTCHPNKTQMGRIEKGFDWLGMWFTDTDMVRSPRSLARAKERQLEKEKRLRLYERTYDIRNPQTDD
ncbi:reverse transcriptase domain-containing protein [Providencia stuartii]|uniref:reverse transcriptase domain-containing protein n=1 Tax=Providencia stuartii TaxID=588 RepID=UPI0023E0AAF9|nr:reverse transcriptase domain-containing protein [Providencia stuartii]ELR5142323.1 RNA-directed DNA polymerase [Providencia stuartii]WER21620.1 reverse transcriptase domain-containing protein [Providencia stuartii]WER25741.1 reverse transcriptase domain-containing protein [Providencia stuartii]WER29830.1 reverse transcriptase domain-containing protein [Providencia stuartii]